MILIAGGAGYIGSHTNKLLTESGYKTVVYDNLVYGHRDFVKWGEFVLGDLLNKDQLRLVFKNFPIHSVMYFAAYAYVGESVENPQKYYINNVTCALNILEVMREFNCNNFIFSSTCATYGNPQYSPIDEKHPQVPINPYGKSKLMVESILKDYSLAYHLKFASLRYFNAAGAEISANIGENHNPETHLIPLVLDVALGKSHEIQVFGQDYDTPDGTAIRDYIHVSDLSAAHLQALEYLKNGGNSDVFNLGNGSGYSVLDVINTAIDVTKINIPISIKSRRLGDPSILVGDASKAKQVLNWNPQFPDLKAIIQSAWNWHKKKSDSKK